MAPSRRRSNTHRQNSSDIEDGHNERESREDVDDEDDEQPRRANRDRASVKGKGRAVAQPVSEAEDDEDERIDVENFTNQPLVKSDVAKMAGLSKDWHTMLGTIRRSTGMVSEVAVALADASDGDGAQKGLIELENLLKNFIDIETEMKINADVIENFGQVIAQGEEISDIVDRYGADVEEKKSAYETKTTRQKYAKVEAFKKFKQNLYEVDHPNEAMPPVTEFIPKEDGDASDDDDELEMGAVTQVYKCPITLRPLENPLTSVVCNHSFSADAIREMFRNDRGAKKCPASGCRASFTLNDCKPDKQLAKRIKLQQRRLRRLEEEMDVEEVVD